LQSPQTGRFDGREALQKLTSPVQAHLLLPNAVNRAKGWRQDYTPHLGHMQLAWQCLVSTSCMQFLVRKAAGYVVEPASAVL